MADTPAIDITSTAFAMRLANLLKATRIDEGRRLGALARDSEGRFSRRDLREYEKGVRALDEISIDDLTQLYRCDLGAILPERLPVSIAPHRISAGGVHLDYQGSGEDALLTAYLSLVRTLRRQKHTPVVDLRREDLEVLAGYLAEPRESVLHRLATLMNASQRKRTAMVSVLATGAAVIGLMGTAAALDAPEEGGGAVSTLPPAATAVVTEPTVTTLAPATTQEPVNTEVATTQAEVTTTAVAKVTRPNQGPAPTTTSTTSTLPMLDTDITTTTEVTDIDGPPLPLP